MTKDAFAQNAQAQGTPAEALSACSRGEYAQARTLAAPLADAGSPEGMLRMAYCCRTGSGMPKDERQWLSWTEKAVQAGNAEAQLNLANQPMRGGIVQKDPRSAFQRGLQAASQGCGPAMIFIGGCYAAGAGTGRDEALAAQWHARAERLGLKPEGSVFVPARQ